MRFNQIFLLGGVLAISILNPGCGKPEAKVYTAPKEIPAPQSAEMAAIPPGHPSMGGAMPAMNPGMGSSMPELNTGTPSPQWKMKAPTQMRLASYEVKGEKEAVADISLIVLGGAAGGILDNVNRWQSQLGQPELTAESLAQKAQPMESPLGKMTLVDLQGLPQGGDPAKDGRIVAAIVSRGDMTLFFKMRGNAELVSAQKEAFVKWIGTVRLGAESPATAPSPTPDSPSK